MSSSSSAFVVTDVYAKNASGHNVQLLMSIPVANKELLKRIAASNAELYNAVAFGILSLGVIALLVLVLVCFLKNRLRQRRRRRSASLSCEDKQLNEERRTFQLRDISSCRHHVEDEKPPPKYSDLPPKTLASLSSSPPSYHNSLHAADIQSSQESLA